MEHFRRHINKLAGYKEAENAMVVNSNEVYLIPNDKFMTIIDGALYLADKESVKGPHLTINTFFNSLAVDYGKKAIGVILIRFGQQMVLKGSGQLRKPEVW